MKLRHKAKHRVGLLCKLLSDPFPFGAWDASAEMHSCPAVKLIALQVQMEALIITIINNVYSLSALCDQKSAQSAAAFPYINSRA